MEIYPLRLQGLQLIRPARFDDARGRFLESYRSTLYDAVGIGPFAQDNLVFSHCNVLRGLHFQAHPGQAKLISVLQGKIWDVAVDCRPHSPTFGQWEAVELDAHHLHQFFLPIGFAHGYCVLEGPAIVQYKVSAPYDALQERSIAWNDPDLAIHWPLSHPLLSQRDAVSPRFKEVYAL